MVENMTLETLRVSGKDTPDWSAFPRRALVGAQRRADDAGPATVSVLLTGDGQRCWWSLAPGEAAALAEALLRAADEAAVYTLTPKGKEALAG